MEHYEVTKRLTFDDVTVHEVGSVIPLSDDEVRLARAVGAIAPLPVQQPIQAASAVVSVAHSCKTNQVQTQTSGNAGNPPAEDASPDSQEE